MIRCIYICILVVLLFISHPATASFVQIVNLETIVQKADLVVYGKAGPKTCYWQDGRIFTRTSFEIEEVWSGATTYQTIEVITLGGALDNIAQNVPGSPTFNINERLVLLLAHEHDNFYYPMGLFQGVYRVTGENSNRLVRRASSKALIIGRTTESPTISLKSLRQKILEAVSAQN
ncbi:MAG: hypothetical protein JW841_00205 [Deltaproteobacteria bacterium]|nr:hypothetical protein [Deltaproteobacteria bacterium]